MLIINNALNISIILKIKSVLKLSFIFIPIKSPISAVIIENINAVDFFIISPPKLAILYLMMYYNNFALD